MPGPATLTLMSNGIATGSLAVTIKGSAPGMFVVNSSGTGLPAAEVLTVLANGSTTVANVFQVNSAGAVVASPVDLSQGQVFLVLFGTGVRGAKQVTATVGGFFCAGAVRGGAGNLCG